MQRYSLQKQQAFQVNFTCKSQSLAKFHIFVSKFSEVKVLFKHKDIVFEQRLQDGNISLQKG